MSYKLMYNGADVTDSLLLSQCNLFDRYGSMLDSITLFLSKEVKPFDFYQYDEIEVIVGEYSTGIMYLDKLSKLNGEYVLDAISYKPANRLKKNRIWNNIRLLAVANDVAIKNGLTLKTYGVTDYTYKTLSQINETDIQFLQRICLREGYSIKIENGCLIIFNEYELENSAIPLKLKPTDINPSYSFERTSEGLSSMTVVHYDLVKNTKIEFSYEDKDIQGGADRIIEVVESVEEARRFAKGYLKNKNKNYLVCNLSMNLRTDISAGTVLNLEGFDKHNGKYVVYEVITDAINEKTYIKCRGILGY